MLMIVQVNQELGFEFHNTEVISGKTCFHEEVEIKA